MVMVMVTLTVIMLMMILISRKASSEREQVCLQDKATHSAFFTSTYFLTISVFKSIIYYIIFHI